jgi:cytochrome c biogenesis protein
MNYSPLRSQSRNSARNVYELFSSMRFAISLLTVLAIASVIGTVLKQNEPYNAYLNQFGQFWFPLFEALGLYSVYHTAWFLLILTFLVISTSMCISRQGPQMLREMRSFREHAKEVSLRQFAHRESYTIEIAPQTIAKLTSHIGEWLKTEGYAFKLNQRDDGVLIAAKRGSGNRLGYLLTHIAIVTICLGGLLDGDMPLKLQMMLGDTKAVGRDVAFAKIPAQSKLGADHWSYRGNVFIPEGKRSDLATLNVGDGILLQELPFDLMLKKFHVDFYSTGMPKRFASDIVIIDKATGQQFEHTIDVNKPVTYKGITLYQASFDDGGSKLQLKAHSLSPGSLETLDINGQIGDSLKLKQREQALTLELSNLRPINVENLTEEKKTGNRQKLLQHLGNAARASEKIFQNVGPSFIFKLRDTAGQAREFHNYMLPVVQDGRGFFMTGMRESQADPFRYLRIPADENGKLETWLALRAMLTDASSHQDIAARFTTHAMHGDAISETMRSKLAATAERTLDIYGSGGYAALDKFLRDTVEEKEQTRAAEIFVKVLQGCAWEAWQLQRERAHLKPFEITKARTIFVDDALNSISDSFSYGAPVYVELAGFEEIKASVIQATRSPGKYIVFLGCALLIAGVFCMLYIHERRLFVLMKNDGEVLFAMATNRKTMDFETAFAQHRERLKQIATGS